MWRTDWTRAFAVVNYEQAVEPFLKTDRLSDTERAMPLGAVCAFARCGLVPMTWSRRCVPA